jgi:hypothetical protein
MNLPYTMSVIGLLPPSWQSRMQKLEKFHKPQKKFKIRKTSFFSTEICQTTNFRIPVEAFDEWNRNTNGFKNNTHIRTYFPSTVKPRRHYIELKSIKPTLPHRCLHRYWTGWPDDFLIKSPNVWHNPFLSKLMQTFFLLKM